MAYSDNFPAQRPIFSLDASNAGRLDPRMTFSRASTGTFFGTEKVLSSENLLLQSEDFTTSWVALDATGAAGATAPDGGTDAYTLTASTGSGQEPRIFQSLIGKLITSTQYTMVGHVKAGTATHGYISFRGNGGNNYAYAQIEFASPSSVSTGGAGFTGISGTVTALGSSWYRLTLTATTSSDVSGAYAFFGPNDGSAFGISGYPAWTSAGETMEVWGAQISSTNTKVYDSPTTTQIARSYQTKLQTAASGVARFEHSASDGQSMGILIESQSTNLLTNSADFGGSWLIDNLTRELAAVGPDGTLSAFAFREETNSNQKRLLRGYTAGGGNVTISVYAKLLGNTRRLVIREVGVTGQSAVFDLATSTKVSGNGSIETVGNGWHRCQLNFSSTSTGHVAGIYLIPADSDGVGYDTSAYAGDGYSGLLLAMPQAEDQSFASSYIDTGTSGSTATRAAESLSMTDSSLFDNGGGSLVVETENVGRAYYAAVLEDDSTSVYQDYVALTVRADNKARQTVNAPGSTGASDEFSAASTVGGSYFKIASRFAPNDFGVCIDGGTVSTDTTGAVPSNVDKLFIGWYDDGGRANAHIKRVAVYNEALSDTNLQALTS